jgi:hypothetical protein
MNPYQSLASESSEAPRVSQPPRVSMIWVICQVGGNSDKPLQSNYFLGHPGMTYRDRVMGHCLWMDGWMDGKSFTTTTSFTIYIVYRPKKIKLKEICDRIFRF